MLLDAVEQTGNGAAASLWSFPKLVAYGKHEAVMLPTHLSIFLQMKVEPRKSRFDHRLARRRILLVRALRLNVIVRTQTLLLLMLNNQTEFESFPCCA